MPWQLSLFTNPIIEPLEDLQQQLSQLAESHREAHTRLRSQGMALTAAAGVEAFVGTAAEAFSESIEHYIAISEQHMQLIDQAIHALSNCVREVITEIDTAASGALNQAVLDTVLSEVSLLTILEEGGQVIYDVIYRMIIDLRNIYLHPGQIWGEAEYLAKEAELLCIQKVLGPFCWNIYYAVKNYVNVLNQLIFPQVIPHKVQVDACVPIQSVGDTAKQISKLQDQEPIEIVKVGPNKILVLLRGLDPNVLDGTSWTSLNSWFNTIDAGAGDDNNPYVLAVQQAILQYIHDPSNHLDANTQVEIVGHSLGGIIAQYVADHKDITGIHVTDVVTLGSPQVTGYIPGVNYKSYTTQYDPVPLLSWYEFKPLKDEYGWGGALSMLFAIQFSGTGVKEIFTGSQRVPDEGNDPFQPIPAHTNYDKSKMLQTQNPIHINISQISDVTYYSVPPQNPVIDSGRAISTLGGDVVFDQVEQNIQHLLEPLTNISSILIPPIPLP